MLPMRGLFDQLGEAGIKKQLPPFVWERRGRPYLTATLEKAGFTNLAALSYEDLYKVWNKHFMKEGNKVSAVEVQDDPSLNPYLLIFCYAFILRGIGEFAALSYRAKTNGLEALNQTNQVVNSKVGPFLSTLPLEILWSVGSEDPIIPAYVGRLTREDDQVLLEFSIGADQLAEFGDLYKALVAKLLSRTD